MASFYVACTDKPLMILLFYCLLLLHCPTPSRPIFANAEIPRSAGGDGFAVPSPSPAPSSPIFYRDRDALIDLKGLFSMANPYISSLLYNWGGEGGSGDEEDICRWTRVQCDDASNVMFLDLSQLQLQGPVPSHAFSAFPSLIGLSLSSNNFSQSIPKDLALCTNLQTLDLSYNSLSSSIPVELRVLRNLTQVDLSSNQLTGEVDTEIFQNWTSLLSLNLSNNEFSGGLPYTNLPSLRFFDLSNNMFNGSLPTKPLGEGMPSLQGLRFSGNKLIGAIPPSFFNTCSPNLQELDLSWNSLWGSIPQTVGNCSALRILSLSRNYLSGYVPGELGNLLQLKSLILGDNHFTGLPSELGLLNLLVYLDLKRNSISGSVPTFLAENKALQYLWLNSNNFSGSLPPEFLQSATLLYLDLSDNALEGSIPGGLQNVSSLQFLFLSGNRLTGSIPEEIGNLKSLEVLDLSFNVLNGSIPHAVGNLQSLLWLMLSNNNLTGPLPEEIVNCSSLLWFNAASNLLSGPLPDDLGLSGDQAATTLKEADDAYVPLPDNAGDCSFLQRWLPTDEGINYNIYFSTLDYRACAAIWNKFIVGRLALGGSSCQGKLTSGYLQLSNNQVTGSIPTSLGSSSLLSFLFLGNNKLTGSIPDTLASLPLINLDLSLNQLNGSISPSFGNLTCLTKLDLSSNNLSGNIPAELENLSQLYSFNVSFNADLSGPIPKGGRFLRFQTSSYLGDERLCFEDGVVRQQVAAGPIATCPRNASQTVGVVAETKHEVSTKTYLKGKMLVVVAAAGALLVVLGAVAAWANFAAVRHREAQRRAGSGELDLLMDYHKGGGNTATEKWVAEMFDGRRRGWVSYADLDWATCSFNDKYLAGKGTSAPVYKANLGGGAVLAVKVFEFDDSNSENFLKHIRYVASLHHPNLVPIIGCLSCRHRHLLLLRFIKRGSLAGILRDSPSLLDWPRRLRVAHDIAGVLAYLHGGRSPSVIHGNVKPSNILLDAVFKPYLADCALAQAIPAGMQPWHALNGANYTAPEHAPALEPTTQGDVYSFGLVLLELVVRQPPGGVQVLKWARATLAYSSMEELVDAQLRSTCADVREAVRFLNVAFSCVHDNPASRPSMDDVAKRLAELSSAEEQRLPCIYAAPA